MTIIQPENSPEQEISLHTNSTYTDYEKLMTFIEENHINQVITEQYNESIGAIMENKSKLFTAVLYGTDILHFINFSSVLKSTVNKKDLKSITTITGNEDLFDRSIIILSFKKIEGLLNYLVNIAEANNINPETASKKFNEPNPITVLISEGVELARNHSDYMSILFSSIFTGNGPELNNLIAIADVINNEKQKRNITSRPIILGKPN